MQHMHQPIMAILVEPCWGFSFVFGVGGGGIIRVFMKKLNPVIEIQGF